MTRPALLRFALLASCLFSTAVPAKEVQLFNDKGFWSAPLQAVANAARTDGISLKISPYANAEQYKTFIQASVASGRTPELFTWWTGASLNTLTATGQLAPLGALWKEMEADGRFQPGVKDLFSVNGQPYAIPLQLSRWVVLYDKRVFARLGLKPPASWAELQTVATRIKAAGQTPFLATTQDGWRGFIWFQELLLRTDPKAYAGLNNGSVAYDSPAVRNVFKIWSDMYAKGWFSDPRSNEEINDFVRGKGVMYLFGDWAVGLLGKAGFPLQELGVFILPNAPGVQQPAIIVEGAPIVVSRKGAANPDVMKTLRFWVSNQGAQTWGKASGNYIGNNKIAAPNAIVSQVNAQLAQTRHAMFLRWWENVPTALQGEMVAEFNRFMLKPDMRTAQNVMQRMQSLNAAYWSKRKKS